MPGRSSPAYGVLQLPCRGAWARSLAAFRPRQGWVPRVAPPILSAHIHDLGFGIFRLGLEGGDQGIFSVDHDVVHHAFMFEANGEFHRRIPVTAVETKVQRWLGAKILSQSQNAGAGRCDAGQNLMGLTRRGPGRSRSSTQGKVLQRKDDPCPSEAWGVGPDHTLQLG
jgi:hypothetical protein